MMETVGIGDRFKCLRICNSTSIIPSILRLLIISLIVIHFSESDRRGLEAQNFQLPPGYHYEWGGEQEESSSSTGDLLLFVPILLVIMISALVLSLGSFRQAAIVAGVAVGCIGTALFSLKVAGSPLGFMAIVGTMGLVGIAINDTIVVLSALNEHPQAREGNRQATEDVVIKATRHVITTTITTIAGFIPLLISGGPFWRPLAIAIAGGISGSSILAIYFVPAVYLIVKRGGKKKVKKEQELKPEKQSRTGKKIEKLTK